jgi:hypothetical protein
MQDRLAREDSHEDSQKNEESAKYLLVEFIESSQYQECESQEDLDVEQELKSEVGIWLDFRIMGMEEGEDHVRAEPEYGKGNEDDYMFRLHYNNIIFKFEYVEN